jgi:hypothetical protein
VRIEVLQLDTPITVDTRSPLEIYFDDPSPVNVDEYNSKKPFVVETSEAVDIYSRDPSPMIVEVN